MTVILGLICAYLGACSTPAPTSIDPSALDVNVTTDPGSPVAGAPIKLRAEVTGAELSKSSGLTFEIRVDEKPVLVEAEKEGNNTFDVIYTFSKSGTYEVYLHLYTEDIHVTKKKQVEIQ